MSRWTSEKRPLSMGIWEGEDWNVGGSCFGDKEYRFFPTQSSLFILGHTTRLLEISLVDACTLGCNKECKYVENVLCIEQEINVRVIPVDM